MPDSTLNLCRGEPALLIIQFSDAHPPGCMGVAVSVSGEKKRPLFMLPSAWVDDYSTQRCTPTRLYGCGAQR
ncbi:hypothetical protein [Erwinia psidii]|uniref:hypothetical protein n=1 Tax=Erwinia psidii TaxID=69224 RepID=UPI00226B01EC|nr:hypothetical protein [Erwinia psidii]